MRLLAHRNSPGQAEVRLTCGQDIAKTGFLTNYSYDALSNLLTVSQGTLSPRTFAYDSLSRLLCAANPEVGGSVTCPNPDNGTYTSGTTRYGYDSDRNITSRIRLAPNGGSGTVTTTYQYDALNRTIQLSYSDGVTLAALFGYDQSNITMGTQQFSISNGIGRLSWTCTAISCVTMTALKVMTPWAASRSCGRPIPSTATIFGFRMAMTFSATKPPET